MVMVVVVRNFFSLFLGVQGDEDAHDSSELSQLKDEPITESGLAGVVGETDDLRFCTLKLDSRISCRQPSTSSCYFVTSRYFQYPNMIPAMLPRLVS